MERIPNAYYTKEEDCGEHLFPPPQGLKDVTAVCGHAEFIFSLPFRIVGNFTSTQKVMRTYVLPIPLSCLSQIVPCQP